MVNATGPGPYVRDVRTGPVGAPGRIPVAAGSRDAGRILLRPVPRNAGQILLSSQSRQAPLPSDRYW